MLFNFDTDGRHLTSIYSPEICTVVMFKLDKPMLCTADMLFKLEDGQWFIMIADEYKLIAGRWVLVI